MSTVVLSAKLTKQERKSYQTDSENSRLMRRYFEELQKAVSSPLKA